MRNILSAKFFNKWLRFLFYARELPGVVGPHAPICFIVILLVRRSFLRSFFFFGVGVARARPLAPFLPRRCEARARVCTYLYVIYR